jgi:cell wall-associated NlpC family hydrolase
VPAARSDTAPGLHARARQVLAQVNALDQRIEQVAEAYDLAGVQLARTRRELRANARALQVARGNLAGAQAELSRILVARYEQGDIDSTLTVVLGARSLSDLIDRVDAVQRLADLDQRVLVQVRAFRARVLGERRRLRREQTDRLAFRRALGQRRAEIESQLAQRQRLLASIRSEAARLGAQERARQERLRREAEARLTAERASGSWPSTSARATPQGSTADPPPGQTQTGSGVGTTTSSGVGNPPPTRHAHVVPILMRYLGVPYQWGGASPSSGFDCSGLVLYVYAQVGVSLPHNAALQYGYGAPVDRADLQPGDIVFFNNLGHDGVYIGGGQFIDAPKTGDVVKIENLNDPAWAAGYVGARRLP